jgi:dGTPase
MVYEVMEWINLLTTARVGMQSLDEEIGRTVFQRDFDRIIFSPAFRRLQSKTQVFPLPEIDFIHTRLTHSLETSSVGRSLGQMVVEKLEEKKPGIFNKNKLIPQSISSVVAAATIAHDIGNPPFGHSGEEAISYWFNTSKGKELIKDLSKEQQADLMNFEGNAMGFRILTKTLPHKSKRTGGLGITAATMGAFTKYPCESIEGNQKGKGIGRKKFGFFQSEKAIFEQTAQQLSLIREGSSFSWKRAPLAFLVEAADDICYLIMDLEDGYRLKLIPFETIEKLLIQLIGDDLIKERYELILDESEKIGYLRAKSINSLVQETSTAFIDNYNEIMSGVFNSSLTEIIGKGEELSQIRKISREKIYSYRKVQEIEAAGFEIISGLLESFLMALTNKNKTRESKIRKLITPTYLYDFNTADEKYEAIMAIIQFIAGMTDRFAIDTFRIIKGISLPNY